MKTAYPVILTRTHDKKDTYMIEIPDFDGATEGYGLYEAMIMARDYIGCACYYLKNKDVPKASSIEDIDPEKGEFADEGESFTTLVDIDIDKYRKMMDKKAVRRNVSIPAWLNKRAEEEHLNVSKVLQNALVDILGAEKS